MDIFPFPPLYSCVCVSRTGKNVTFRQPLQRVQQVPLALHLLSQCFSRDSCPTTLPFDRPTLRTSVLSPSLSLSLSTSPSGSRIEERAKERKGDSHVTATHTGFVRVHSYKNRVSLKKRTRGRANCTFTSTHCTHLARFICTTTTATRRDKRNDVQRLAVFSRSGQLDYRAMQ